jgi:hypothetical protein
MFTDHLHFQRDGLVFRDRKGARVELTFDEAIDFYCWLLIHLEELEQRALALHAESTCAEESLQRGQEEFR